MRIFTLVFVCVWVIGVLSALPIEAKPPTSIKYSIIREENPNTGKETLILPYAFSTESMGFTVGVGGGAKGYGQDQFLIAGTVFGSTDEAVGIILGMWDYQLPFTQRLFFSAIGSMGHFPRQRAYTSIAFEPGSHRAGSNDSDRDDFVETSGFDNWLDFSLDFVLPIGAAQENSVVSYHLKEGLLKSQPSSRRYWNPLTSGVTLFTLRQYNRYQTLLESSGRHFMA